MESLSEVFLSEVDDSYGSQTDAQSRRLDTHLMQMVRPLLWRSAAPALWQGAVSELKILCAPWASITSLHRRVACLTHVAHMQITRTLPWRPAATTKRQTEQVRPIFWSNRPRAYLKRTSDWDSYPAGRWGNAASPAYGEVHKPPYPAHVASQLARLCLPRGWCGALATVQAPMCGHLLYEHCDPCSHAEDCGLSSRAV